MREINNSTRLASVCRSCRPRYARCDGATLIVVLIIMTTISLLSLASMSDTTMQLNMVRNDQFYVNAYRVSNSEINAQIDSININASTEDDEIILSLLELDLGSTLEVADDELLGPHAGSSAFDQTVGILPVCEIDSCPSPPGYSHSKYTKVYRGEINSIASMSSSASASNQSQGFWYLLPQSGVTTFD